MKILFITNNFPPIVDGVGDYTVCLAKEFANNFHDVTILCRQNTSISTNYKSIRVLPIIPSWNKRGIKLLLKEVLQIKPDMVLLQYVPYGFNYYGAPFSLIYLAYQLNKKNIKLYTIFHEVHIRFSLKPKQLIIHIAQRLISYRLGKYSKALVTSIEFYGKLLNNWRSKTFIIPIGANILVNSSDEKNLKKLKKEIAPKNEFIISTFGVRDLSKLIIIFNQLKKEFCYIKLLVCGKVNNNNLSKSGDIIFTGYLEDQKLIDHLRISDLFVMMDYVSSRGEGGTCNKSGALAAAFAASLPIVGMAGDMNNDLLKNGENIILANYNNNTELKNTLNKLINDSNLRNILSENAKKLFDKHLNWESIYRKYIEIQKSLT